MHNTNGSKTAYVSPKLAVYGAFSQLTANGSIAGNENPSADMIILMG